MVVRMEMRNLERHLTTQFMVMESIQSPLTFYRHKIVIAGNHEITFDRASFDNIYAKKKVFGENYDPSDPEVRSWNITLP